MRKLISLASCVPVLVSVIGMAEMANADSYIVLFKNQMTSAPNQTTAEKIVAMHEVNKQNITNIQNERIAGESLKINDNLWAIAGVTMDLTAQQVEKLKTSRFVKNVLPDRNRQMLNPIGNPEQAPGPDAAGSYGIKDLWGIFRIRVPDVRADFPTINGTGMRVGILDTGIEGLHEQLVEPASPAPSFLKPKSRVVMFKDFVSGIPHAYDDHGHGTHVAGTIGGLQTGVAPGVKFIVGKILSGTGSGSDSQIIKGMQWMVDPDGNPNTNDLPTAVSNSWGGDIEASDHDISAYDAYRRAIQAWRDVGIVPLFAAGNSGKVPNGIPGGLPEAISIGATQADDGIAKFSSRGPNIWTINGADVKFQKPNISAPGHQILSSLSGRQYAVWSGTSMATPHVSGSVVLCRQMNPALNVQEVEDRLYATAHKRPDVYAFGNGLLDTYSLIQACK